jgi:hypothetical protein
MGQRLMFLLSPSSFWNFYALMGQPDNKVRIEVCGWLININTNKTAEKQMLGTMRTFAFEVWFCYDTFC